VTPLTNPANTNAAATTPSRMIELGIPPELAPGHSSHNEPFRNRAFVYNIGRMTTQGGVRYISI
jgi:hypothetical protein